MPTEDVDQLARAFAEIEGAQVELPANRRFAVITVPVVAGSAATQPPKTTAARSCWTGPWLVAGAGFEPATFGL